MSKFRVTTRAIVRRIYEVEAENADAAFGQTSFVLPIEEDDFEEDMLSIEEIQ